MSKSRAKTRISKPTSGGAAPTRRCVLKLVTLGVGATVATAGGGYWAVGSFQIHTAEHDLSRVGQGDPVIVQVHDPQCPTCTALQRETRRALKDFDDCGLTYLVADITTVEGSAFASKYRVPHVTLLFFDGEGELRNTVTGMQQAEHLADLFAAHKVAAA